MERLAHINILTGWTKPDERHVAIFPTSHIFSIVLASIKIDGQCSVKARRLVQVSRDVKKSI